MIVVHTVWLKIKMNKNTYELASKLFFKYEKFEGKESI